VRGQTARVALRAEATAAYAFSEDEADELDHSATGGATIPRPDGRACQRGAANEKHPSASETTAPPRCHGDAPGVEAALEVVPAEDAPASAPHVAGGPAAKPHKEPPNAAQARPERGLSELRGVRPDQLGPVLGMVHAAASADVAQARTAQQANPPR